jgi:hypothetical protein
LRAPEKEQSLSFGSCQIKAEPVIEHKMYFAAVHRLGLQERHPENNLMVREWTGEAHPKTRHRRAVAVVHLLS